MNNKFTQQWLEILCTQLPGVESGLFMIRNNQSKQLKLAAKWPAELKQFGDFGEVIKYALKKRQTTCFPKAVATEEKASDLYAHPIFVQSQLLGVLILRTRNESAQRQKAIQNWLKKSTHWLKLASPSKTQQDDFYGPVVALLAACFEQRSYQQGLISMVSEMTLMFDCERVAFAELKGHYSQVVALSNSADFNDRSNLMKKVADAMDEAIEQDNIIAFPEPNAKTIQRSHQELSRQYGSGSILTIPLVHGDQVFGAVTLLRSEETPFTPETIRLCQQAFSLLAPYLALKKEQEKNLLLKIGASVRQQLQTLFGIRHLKIKLATSAVLALLSFGSLIQADHRVTADAVLEGRIQRVITAPFPGYLLSATVSAGDTVAQGDIMATLNGDEIELELKKLKGELQKARREYREAQSTRNLVKVSVVNEQIRQTTAKIELAQQRLERINLTAPFDGVVIEGDLNQLLGAPVERGEALFKIAPLEGYRIILKVNERQISYIQQGQNGRLILPSLSDHEFPLTVEKITAASQAEDGANIFRVEASLGTATDLLRPGMQGVGKINAGQARLIWIWTHEITDWLRLWFWSWWP